MKTELSYQQYTIGGTLEVNRVGYGAMQLTGNGVWKDPDNIDGAKLLLKKAVELGVNFIDTADAYGPFTNEILIRDALYPYRDKLVIATKGGLTRTGPNEWHINGNPKHIKAAIDSSLQRLKIERIDLWQLHRIDPSVPVAETLGPVADAVKAGKINQVGLSEVGIEQIEEASKTVAIASIQNMYNLSERKWEKVVDYTEKNKIAFIPWFPLASGPESLSPKIKSIANKHQATIAQIALAWLLKRSSNILLIPGTKSIIHLEENIAACNVTLSEEEFIELSK